MKNIFYRLFTVCFAGLCFSSCITNKDKLYLQNKDNTAATAIPFQPYRLHIDDEIVYYLITSNAETQDLYNEQNSGGNISSDRSVTFPIGQDGCIVLPTIGRVQLAGMTLREAERRLTGAFQKIVIDAEVKIALANNYFYVEGDGGKGRFNVYKENLTIFQALALAGDISSTGDKKQVKIIRRGIDGIDQLVAIDLRQKAIIGSEFYYIQPNDVIYIPSNKNAFFRVESASGFISLVVAPLSLVIMALTFFNK
jgi:polysaccharide export outer membrane protein